MLLDQLCVIVHSALCGTSKQHILTYFATLLKNKPKQVHSTFAAAQKPMTAANPTAAANTAPEAVSSATAPPAAA